MAEWGGRPGVRRARLVRLLRVAIRYTTGDWDEPGNDPLPPAGSIAEGAGAARGVGLNYD